MQGFSLIVMVLLTHLVIIWRKYVGRNTIPTTLDYNSNFLAIIF